MNPRHILLCLALSLLGSGLQAQNELPQVFSPNAAELGKYGKIPVSYFNGLPNISIPLTELKARNYTLPIYLTYHAGGNRPDQHPGWVGLGWTLHAGGCINRIVNGMIDELCNEEQAALNATSFPVYGTTSIDDPGYWFRGYIAQEDSVIHQEKMSHPSYKLVDKEPDEFQVCVDGLDASFFFSGDGGVRVKSRGEVDFTVQVHFSESDNNQIEMYPSLNPFAGATYRTRIYRYIRSIDLVTSLGVKYSFGGDDASIEISSSHLTGPSLSQSGEYQWTSPIGHVNSWLLRRITFPDGEEIIFDYERRGIPIVKAGCYNLWSITYGNESSSSILGEASDYDTYTFLFPCYLKTITCSSTGEILRFVTSKSTELAYAIHEVEMAKKTGAFTEYHTLSQFQEENYYLQLDTIKSKQGWYAFDYSHSQDKRLQLNKVSILNQNEESEGEYDFRYNENGNLPGYNSRKTDRWGYYNGQEYPWYSPQAMDAVRIPVFDSTRVGILERILYPTGGFTDFEYEPNLYSGYVSDDSLRVASSSGQGGGLRIKRITDCDGERVSRRTFHYVRESGESSGTLSGIPRFYFVGQLLRNEDRFNEYLDGPNHTIWYNMFNLELDPDGLADFSIGSEQYINELIPTEGSHVIYDRVVEVFEDGSKKIRRYRSYDSDPDEAPRLLYGNYNGPGLRYKTSGQSSYRGLLSREEDRSSSGTLVRSTDYQYTQTNSGPPLGAVAQVFYGTVYAIHRFYYYKVDTAAPYLQKTVETVYPDDGGTPHIETTEYTYDSHRRLTKTIRIVNGTTERDTLTYTGNLSTGDYARMAAKNMISYPVEHVRFRKEGSQPEKVISADLTTWKRWGDVFVPSELYRANDGPGLTRSFRYYNGRWKDFSYDVSPELKYTAYDTLGNVLLTEDLAANPTTYVWTPDGCHPAAVFPGAKEGYTKYIASDVSRTVTRQLDSEEDISLQFESVSSFTLKIWLTCPNNQCWDLSPEVDGTTYRIVCVNDPQAPNPWPAHAASYPSPLTIPLGAGTHTVSIHSGSHFYAMNSTDPATCSIELNYKEKQVTEQQVAGHTVVFEDFEDEPGELAPEGYHSGKGHRGIWTHSLDASGSPYIVDYRVYRNGGWHYVRQTVTGSSATIREGMAPIDHVRIYPVSSLPESYTWYSDGLLRSRTDPRGVTESYRYDGLGRLVGVYDNEGKKVEGYEYNYQNR